jgi:hypothetical protein
MFHGQVLAYLDPGSGAVLLQAIAGGIAALGVALRLFRSKIRAALKLKPRGDAGTADRQRDE